MIDARLVTSPVAPQPAVYPGIAGLQFTGGSADEKGTIIFDPSILFAGNSSITRTITLVAELECTLGGSVQTCSLELFNITDGVTVVTNSTQNNFATSVTSADIPIGAGAGKLPNGQRLYGLRLTRTGGTAADVVSCKLAELFVKYT